jgi:hypothetical protein
MRELLSGLRATLAGLGILVLLLAPVQAEVASDQGAALLEWPDIVVVAGGIFGANATTSELGRGGLDTIIQLSNVSQEAVLVHCFYENATPHCSDSGIACLSSSQCCNGSAGCGSCRPGWVETDFRVQITPRQPLGWLASEGLSIFPLSGAPGSTGPDGSSNSGSRIPPVPEAIFTGSLRCVAINQDGTPSDRNVLKGEATRVRSFFGQGNLTVEKHNAIGFRAFEGAVNDDRELVLGGPDAEYEGCANFLIVNHLFDFGVNPVVTDHSTVSRIVLVPCSTDYRRQIPGQAIVQYLVYNEFEQRFSTSRPVVCKSDRLLSLTDTTDPERSIFSAGVSGTTAGQTRINPIGSGLVGIASEGLASGEATDPNLVPSILNEYTGFLLLAAGETMADFNIHQQGDRPDPDFVRLP